MMKQMKKQLRWWRERRTVGPILFIDIHFIIFKCTLQNHLTKSMFRFVVWRRAFLQTFLSLQKAKAFQHMSAHTKDAEEPLNI